MSLLQGTENYKVINAQLVASETDSLCYTTYVFRNLDENSVRLKYLMCVRYPNWNHRNIKLGEKGFLSYLPIIAGIDTWYDGEKQIPYKYSNIQFIKFIEMQDENYKYIM